MDSFMKDRYGVDDLSTAAGAIGMILALVGLIANWQWLMICGLVIIGLALARALSKNKSARQAENASYQQLRGKIPFLSKSASSTAGPSFHLDAAKRQARTAHKMWKERKTKAFLKCPACHTTLSVPRGKGRMIVTCPKCKTRMETRS